MVVVFFHVQSILNFELEGKGFEIPCVLVRFNLVARFIVNANHSVM